MAKLMCFMATQKGLDVFSSAIKEGRADAFGCIISFKERVAESFDKEFMRVCAEHHIPFFYWSDVKDCIDSIAVKYCVTGVVAIGWRYILPLSLNNILEHPIIVFHDSLLPKYRGFAPTPTAIIAGDDKVGVTALFATGEVDKGEIIWQKEVPVGMDDHIQDVINRQAAVYAEGFLHILKQMDRGCIDSLPQDEGLATYSIWRSPEDCRINWNSSAKEIYNFVRALGSPYPSAYTHYKGEKIFVIRVSLVADLNFVIRDCGKLWQIKENRPVVICGEGMIQIEDAVNAEGQAVVFDILRCKLC